MKLPLADALDEQVATALGIEYNPHFHRFSSDDEACQWLVERLAEHDMTLQLDGAGITVSQGRNRLFTQAGDTPRLALAKAALRISADYPQLLA